MCGIAGIIGTDPAHVAAALTRMTAAQVHRGPDAHGQQVLPFGGAFLGLGHRRLSILDLSPAGHQPMVHPRSGAWLVFNGEIYNFAALRRELEALGETFVGHSDSEVLLHALSRWGPACLPRLQGMYAFAYFDPGERRLILARDPAGIKPLCMAQAGGSLLFASEVRALLASGLVRPRLDPQGVAGLLAYGAVPQPQTLFADVRSLPPGCWQEFRAADDSWRAGSVQRFWEFPEVRTDIGVTKALDLVRTTLDAAVRDHLVADVPVGLFLSGGLDSTILAGLAARHQPALQCFTVSFTDQPDFSEAQQAAETARRFGLRHTTIPLPADETEAAAREWMAALDQPSMDGLNVYVLARAVRQQGIKVALSGLGSDELFGGYPSFRDVPRLRRLLRWGRSLPAGVRRGLAGAATVGRARAVRAKLADMAEGDGSLRSLYLHRRRVLSNRQLLELGIEPAALDLTPAFLQADGLADLPDDETDPIRTISELESRFYQGNVLLRDADANGMAHGLEIRVPFLDQRLLDQVHALSGAVRLPPRAAGKHLLRQAFQHLLSAEQLQASKRGFFLPLRRWMVGPLRPLCEQAMMTLKDVGWLRPEGIDGVWRSFQQEPESPQWTRALTLCVLGSFIQKTGAHV